MSRNLTRLGFMTLADLEAAGQAPSAPRRAAGPVAVVECVQNIPCNPCEEACKVGAIRIGADITNIPSLDEAACTGCGLCVAACPGQAVFIVDETHGPDTALISLPYEFLPLPAKGQRVTALDRAGNELGPATIVRVLASKSMDRTAVVSMAVPRAWAMQARFFRTDDAPACAVPEDKS